MAEIYSILKVFSLFLMIVTTVLSLAIPKQKLWITLYIGFLSGFLLFFDFRNGIFLGFIIPGIIGILTSVFFAFGGLRIQNNAENGWKEYKRTHWR